MSRDIKQQLELKAISLPDGFIPNRSSIDFDSSTELEAAAPPRPEFNGTLLHNPAGTLWLVINGEARGYTSGILFERLHDWSWRDRFTVDGYISASGWLNHTLKWTDIADIRFIKEGAPWSDSLRYVRNSAGTEAIFDDGVLYGVPSARVRARYQLRQTKALQIPDEEWNSYPMPVILVMPDGSE